MSDSRKAIIATRRLSVSASGRAKPVTVKIGKPRKAQTGEWACPFWIIGLKSQVADTASGEDAVQALVLALEAIRLKLKKLKARISWLDERDGGDFPQYVTSLFGTEVTRRIEKLIQRELLRALRQEVAKNRKKRPR